MKSPIEDLEKNITFDSKKKMKKILKQKQNRKINITQMMEIMIMKVLRMKNLKVKQKKKHKNKKKKLKSS